MLIEFLKSIHKKYLNFFKFILFLRYLIAIFIVAITFFLLIPKTFDYRTKDQIIKNHLIKKYNLNIQNYNNIKYNIFPLPNLSINDLKINIVGEPIFLKVQNLNLFLELSDIYNFDSFNSKKIIVEKSYLNLDLKDIYKLIKIFHKLENKIGIKNLNLNLLNNLSPILKIEEIDVSNYGYKKENVYGKIFKKNFKISLKNNYENLYFKVLNSGIKAEFSFNNFKNNISGVSKISILNNYLYSNFSIKEGFIEILDSSLRNKDLFVKIDSLIKFDPYFEVNSNINIKEIDSNLISNLNLNKILKNREIINKLNSNNKIFFNKKKLRNGLINNFFLETQIAHGRLNSISIISIDGAVFKCKSESILTEKYPRIYFNCNLNIDNKKNSLKNFQ